MTSLDLDLRLSADSGARLPEQSDGDLDQHTISLSQLAISQLVTIKRKHYTSVFRLGVSTPKMRPKQNISPLSNRKKTLRWFECYGNGVGLNALVLVRF